MIVMQESYIGSEIIIQLCFALLGGGGKTVQKISYLFYGLIGGAMMLILLRMYCAVCLHSISQLWQNKNLVVLKMTGRTLF